MPDEKQPKKSDETPTKTPKSPDNKPAKKFPLPWIIGGAAGAGALLLFCCFGCIGIGIVGNRDRPAGGFGGNAKAVSELPADQEDFIKQVESFIAAYKSAPNELKKSGVRADRRDAIQKVIPGRKVKDWLGTLDSMGTNGDGDAYLVIKLQGSRSIIVKTWNNALSDIGDRTLIKNGSETFRKASNLAAGKKVIFSGDFVSGDVDYIRESSLTERGSMTDPAFMFRFEDIAAR